MGNIREFCVKILIDAKVHKSVCAGSQEAEEAAVESTREGQEDGYGVPEVRTYSSRREIIFSYAREWWKKGIGTCL